MLFVALKKQISNLKFLLFCKLGEERRRWSQNRKRLTKKAITMHYGSGFQILFVIPLLRKLENMANWGLHTKDTKLF